MCLQSQFHQIFPFSGQSRVNWGCRGDSPNIFFFCVKPVPGWSLTVKPFRDKAHFWHQVWISAGRPLNTQLHKIMKKSKDVYHFQYRKCKKAEDMIVKNKLLDACINGNGDIFAEIRKLRKSKPPVATNMDGEKHDIPAHFKNIFEDIYNSANDQDELKVT